MVKNEKAKMMYEQYIKGFSLSDVGKMFNVTRQSAYSMFKCRGLEMRKKKKLPFIIFKNKKYTLRNIGYYGKTDGKRTLLHRDMWEEYNGKIKKGFDIHHINHNKTDNRVENLLACSDFEYNSKFSTGHNQYTKCKK